MHNSHANSYNKHGVVPFKGENYPDWSFRVEMILEEADLLKYIEDFTEVNNRNSNWKKNDLKARRIIVDCVDNTCLEYIKDKDCANEMWTGLKAVFEASSYTKRVIAFKKLIRLSYEMTEKLQTFFHSFDVVAREYKSAGGTLAEMELIVIMLSCLPDEFNGVVTVISAIEEDLFTIDRVRGLLLEEECRIKDRNSLPSNSTETTTAFFNNSNIRCFNCNGRGHTSANCFKPQRSRHEQSQDNNDKFSNRDDRFQNKKKKWNKNKHNSFKKNGSGHVLILSPACQESQKNLSKFIHFICDSGCSDHLTNDLSILSNVRDIDPVTYNLANKGGSLKVTKIGTLNVKSIVNGREMVALTISNVHYCENASVNLLSIGSLDDKGVDFTLTKGFLKASRNGKSLFNAEKVGRLYIANFELMAPTANVVNSVNESDLWHRRLGHLSMQTIYDMKKSNMVNGISKDVGKCLEFCECCVESKMTRNKFVNSRPQTKRPLERIHSDVCGPFPCSYNGYLYYVTFIDDFTHVTNIYLLKNKSEVFDKFKEYCQLAENHFGLKVSRLRCDNGGEYTSNLFKRYCTEKGIVIEYTVPYNPESNGVSERMNRTLCEKARAMLNDCGLPAKFWNEAVLTATFLTNRSSTVCLKGKTPYEMWYGNKPDLSKLKVFGCKAFSHVPKEKRKGKVGLSALPGKEFIFVGYGINGYRLYDAANNKVVMGHSVRFNENAPAVQTDVSESVTSASPISYQPFPAVTTTTDEGSPLNQTETPPTPIVPSTPTPIIVTHNPVSARTPSTVTNATPSGSQTPVRSNNPVNNEDIVSTPIVSTRYPQRERRVPFWQRGDEFEMYYAGFVGLCEEVPKNFDDVSGHEEQAEWRSSIADEIQSLLKNHTWDVVDNPGDKKLLDSRWIFKRKLNGSDYIYKSRLVVKGFMQTEGVDFKETYAPVARLQTIRILLAIGNQFNLEIEHLDVKTAFLNGDLEEDVYMRAPKGIDVGPGKILKLRKSLYGLKQAPRCWNFKFHNVMLKLGFKRCNSDPCLYIKSSDKTISIIVLYVDDMLFLSNDRCEMKTLKMKMSEEFELKDMGNVVNFMGLQIKRDRNAGILNISQETYANSILKRFEMSDCNPRAIPIEPKLDLSPGDPNERTNFPYRELLGSLMYLMLGSRPDLSFSINKLSRFQETPTDEHWSYLKGILRYIKGTSDYELVYSQSNDDVLCTYADSDWANDNLDRKSTTGFLIKVFGNVVIWASKKQQQVTLSTTEAEYVAACTAVQETLWTEKLLHDLDIEIQYPISVYEDNYGCCMISKNPETKRSKHIDVKFHFLRNLVWDGRYQLIQISTENQVADLLTKGLPRSTLEKFLNLLRLKRGGV